MNPQTVIVALVAILMTSRALIDVTASEARESGCGTSVSIDFSSWDGTATCPPTNLSQGEFQSSESDLPEWCSWRQGTAEEEVKYAKWRSAGAETTSKLFILGCGADPNETGRDAGQGGSAFLEAAFVEEREAPPDPAVLAEQAYQKLTVPSPQLGVGPDPAGVFVQLPTWLWVDDPGVLTATVAAGGVSVTATASLASTTWTVGEPDRNPDFTGFRPGPAVTETCQGAGTPPPADVDWKAEPPCGHTFRWRSLPERTNGTGKWPITATTSWAVTWQSNTGQSGSGTLTATGQDAVAVGEYRILLVNGGR